MRLLVLRSGGSESAALLGAAQLCLFMYRARLRHDQHPLRFRDSCGPRSLCCETTTPRRRGFDDHQYRYALPNETLRGDSLGRCGTVAILQLPLLSDAAAAPKLMRTFCASCDQLQRITLDALAGVTVIDQHFVSGFWPQ